MRETQTYKSSIFIRKCNKTRELDSWSKLAVTYFSNPLEFFKWTHVSLKLFNLKTFIIPSLLFIILPIDATFKQTANRTHEHKRVVVFSISFVVDAWSCFKISLINNINIIWYTTRHRHLSTISSSSRVQFSNIFSIFWHINVPFWICHFLFI